MKKIARLLAMGICVLLVTLLLRGYTAAFTAAHFPDTQPGTYWTASSPCGFQTSRCRAAGP